MKQDPVHLFTAEEEYRNIFENASDGLIIYDIESEVVIEVNRAACEMHGYSHQEFVGLRPIDFMLPESYAVFAEHVRTAKTDHVMEALVIHKRKNGSLLHVEVRRSMLNYQNRPCLLSIVRDVGNRIQTERLLSRQIEARRREQATLLSISHTLASTLELQPELILDQLRGIIEYTHGGLFVLEESTLVTLAMRGTGEVEKSVPIRIRLKTPETLIALFNQHQPICIDDVNDDTPQSQFLHSLLDEEAAMLLDGMRSWMWVPLAVRGRIIGGIGVAHEQLNYFSSHHADLALSVANQAAITMINAELYGRAQELAVLEERQRLARNLHDAVNQSLFSAGLIAEVLPRLWDKDQVEARRSLEDLRRLTRGAMAEMRALLAELRPSTLTDSDLGDLVHLLGNAFSGRTNIPVVITTAGEFTLTDEVQVAFYRLCQEALNNVAKHAKASQVEIDLKQTENIIELCIHDNGLGFNPKEVPAGHYGLTMMRERAEKAEVQLTVKSEPGHGTHLIIQWEKPTTEESV